MMDMKLECPKCHKVYTVPQYSPGRYCDCHLYCSSGDKPSDCSMTTYNWSGQLGWPVGAHQNSGNEGDDVLHRTYYCSTHSKYTYKMPVFIEADWKKWRRKRAKERFRLLKKR